MFYGVVIGDGLEIRKTATRPKAVRSSYTLPGGRKLTQTIYDGGKVIGTVKLSAARDYLFPFPNQKVFKLDRFLTEALLTKGIIYAG